MANDSLQFGSDDHYCVFTVWNSQCVIDSHNNLNCYTIGYNSFMIKELFKSTDGHLASIYVLAISGQFSPLIEG